MLPSLHTPLEPVIFSGQYSYSQVYLLAYFEDSQVYWPDKISLSLVIVQLYNDNNTSSLFCFSSIKWGERWEKQWTNMSNNRILKKKHHDNKCKCL